MEQNQSRWMREKPLKVDFQALIDSQPGARKRIIAATGVSRVRTYQWVRAPDKHCVTIADILGIQPGVLRPDIFTAPIAKSNAVEDLDGQIAIGASGADVALFLRDRYYSGPLAAARLAAIGALEKIGPLDEKQAAGVHGVVDAALKAYFNEMLKGESN